MAFQWIMRHEILIIFDNSSSQLISKFMSSDITFFQYELCTHKIEGVTVLFGSEPDLKDRWIWDKIRLDGFLKLILQQLGLHCASCSQTPVLPCGIIFSRFEGPSDILLIFGFSQNHHLTYPVSGDVDGRLLLRINFWFGFGFVCKNPNIKLILMKILLNMLFRKCWWL